MEDLDFIGTLGLGILLGVVICWFLFFAIVGGNTEVMCMTMKSEGYPVAYVNDTDACMYITESGNLVPFKIEIEE